MIFFFNVLLNGWLKFYLRTFYYQAQDFPGGAEVKNLPANAGDSGSVSGSGRSPRGGNDKPLQYSHLGNTMCRVDWQATVHGVTMSQT